MHKCKHKDMKTERLLLLLPDSYPVAISESGGGGGERRLDSIEARGVSWEGAKER